MLPVNATASRLAAHITSMFARACKTHRTTALPTETPHSNGVTEENGMLPFVRTDPNLFPCLLVSYGSGATFSLVGH